jgi:hypothetical protein
MLHGLFYSTKEGLERGHIALTTLLISPVQKHPEPWNGNSLENMDLQSEKVVLDYTNCPTDNCVVYLDPVDQYLILLDFELFDHETEPFLYLLLILLC